MLRCLSGQLSALCVKDEDEYSWLKILVEHSTVQLPACSVLLKLHGINELELVIIQLVASVVSKLLELKAETGVTDGPSSQLNLNWDLKVLDSASVMFAQLTDEHWLCTVPFCSPWTRMAAALFTSYPYKFCCGFLSMAERSILVSPSLFLKLRELYSEQQAIAFNAYNGQ